MWKLLCNRGTWASKNIILKLSSNTIRVVAETEDEIEGENDDFLINNEITDEDHQLMDQLEQNGASDRQVCVGVGIWAQIPGKVFI